MKPAKNTAFAQGFLEQSSTQLESLGLRVKDEFGVEYAYSRAGGTALAAGKATQAVAATANHANIAVATAAAIGATKVQVTLGATAATLNQYKDGQLVVNDATGEGHAYRIKGNPAADASGSLWVDLEDAIRVALVAGTSQVTLYPNKFSGNVVSTTEENECTGVAPIVVTADYYYWSVVKGDVPCLIDGTPAVGTMLTFSATAGAVAAINATLDIDQPVIGRMPFAAGVDTEYRMICIDV